MKFSTHVALPKHNIHVKYHVKIYVYSDVITFCDSLISFYVFVASQPSDLYSHRIKRNLAHT